MRREFCRDCGAELQVIERGGFEFRRCPWVRGEWWRNTSLTVTCGQPFRRTFAGRPVDSAL